MKKEKRQAMVGKILHRIIKIEQHEPNKKPGMNPGAPEGQTVLSPLVAPFELLLHDMNIMTNELLQIYNTGE